MRLRTGAAVAAAALCAVTLMLVSTATSAAAAASKPRPTAVLAGFSGDYAQGTIANLTPYSWKFVDDGGIGSDTHPQPRFSNFPETLDPGQDFVYSLIWTDHPHASTWDYDGWFTYRADTLHGPEYLSIYLEGARCTLLCPTNGDPMAVQAYVTSTAPTYQAGVISFAPKSNPEIGWTSGGNAPVFEHFGGAYTADFDYTFLVKGNYTVDASTSLGAPFVSLLNTICGSNAKACSFTQKGPLVWGIDKPVKSGLAANCTVPRTATRGSPPVGAAGGEPPPQYDPNWLQVGYEAKQSAKLSVGAGLTATTEFNLFNSIGGKISVEVEAEHEWDEVKTFTRESKVYIPSNNIAAIWVAPVVGTVTGTLVVSNGSATFTATNFTEQRSGVTKDPLTPAFNVITQIRPMTPAEYQANCMNPSPSGVGSGKPTGKPMLSRSLARVKRGQTRAEVLRELGRPLVQRFTTKSCRARDLRCDALGGRGGTWVYRDVSVVFGANHRVSALIDITAGHLRMVMA